MITTGDITRWVASIPPAVWIALMGANLLLTVITWSAARRRVRHAGHRAGAAAAGRDEGRDTLLTVATLIPAVIFWLMVLGGSLHGLVAFGHDTLGWHDGWQYLVPGTLDGVSVTFAMLAFRAVKHAKTPDRCYRVVWGAALASATINFVHEYAKAGNVLAGGYVALLSVFGMVLFDEFLSQFEIGAQTVRRDNPKFGIRWLTWPSNTLLAAIAWRNHPPVEGTAGTVANAVANLDRVRAAKRAARRAHAVDSAPASPPTPAASGTSVTPASPASPPRPAVVANVPRTRSVEADGEVKVPSTAAAVTRWAQTWITMCHDPDLSWDCMQDDRLARDRFQFSARHLRYIRDAASSGALQRRAQQLGVGLPDGFDEYAATLIMKV